jgi:hypothetical protein
MRSQRSLLSAPSLAVSLLLAGLLLRVRAR